MNKIQPIIVGILSGVSLLAVYFSIVTLISGWSYAQDQFRSFWYFIVALSLGFGIQVGLYAYLREKIKNNTGSTKMLAITGGTSTAAMISCCSHYLVNILPIIGIGALASLITQYQVEFFWVAIGLNIIGILFISNRGRKAAAK